MSCTIPTYLQLVFFCAAWMPLNVGAVIKFVNAQFAAVTKWNTWCTQQLI